MRAVAILPLLLATGPARAQDEGGSVRTPRPLLERVVAIGASVSTGMDLGVDVAAVLEPALLRAHDPVRAHHDVLFFMKPLEVGPAQVAATLADDPTLVVAVDYLFWFGYGAVNASGGVLVDEAERLPLLEKGLAELDRLRVPLVVGDFPDMSAAVGKMLRADQVPAQETRARLNARLHAWARARGDVIVLPLSRVIAGMRSDEPFRIGRQHWPEGCSDLVLQADRLHPTIEGLAAVAHLIVVELVEAGWVAEGDVDLDLARVLDRLGEPPPAGG